MLQDEIDLLRLLKKLNDNNLLSDIFPAQDIPEWQASTEYDAGVEFTFSTTNTTAVDINGDAIPANKVLIGAYQSGKTSSSSLTSVEMALIELRGGVEGDAATQGGDNDFTGSNEFDATFGAWLAIPYAAVLNANADTNYNKVTLTGNATLTDVANKRAAGKAQNIRLSVSQDGTGTRLLSYDTAVFKAEGANFPTLSTGANAVDWLLLQQDTDGKFVVSMDKQDVRST